MNPVQRILVPVDFSSRSKAALDHALVLAEALGASITLLHVVETAPAMGGIVPGADHDDETVRRAARSSLDLLVAGARVRGFNRIDTVIDGGWPIEDILHRARNGAYQMIVMGTHGRTGVGRLVVGSIAEGVLRRADCPVVTLHLPKSTDSL